MDENARRRRQNEEQSYAGPDSRLNPESQRPSISGLATERYRSSALNTSTPTTRGVPPASTAYSGFYQVASPSFSTNLQYQTTTGYGQDQRQQVQPGFATYSPDIMYNVSQPNQQANAYNTATPYQARQSPAIQLVPDVSTPYFSGESSSAPDATNLQHHTASNTDSTVYPQHQHQPSSVERASLSQHNYPALTMGGIPQAPEVIEEEHLSAPGPGMEVDYTTYQSALKEIFQNIIHGRLSEASQSLLHISEWFLRHVGDLGLTVDEVTLHADRIRLWGEFNVAWLGIFQKQKDLLESDLRIVPPQSLMTHEFIDKMAKVLIDMCDSVERHGLVDYQLGVAEEHIFAILIECLDIQESLEKMDGGAASQSPGNNRAP